MDGVENTPESIIDDARWAPLQRKAQEVQAARAFRLFRSHNIEPILIKGLAAARSYPVDRPRPSVDMDLAVSASTFPAALELCRSDSSVGLAIDIHDELRHLDSVEWNDLFSNSITVDAEGTALRFLRAEDHLRVLCVHWLTDGAANQGRLWDIYYLVQNRSADFEWERFLDVVSETRQRWLKCTLGLAEKYLGLDLDGTPVAGAATSLPKWLIRTVEREWASETPIHPLSACLHDPKMLIKQLRKRLPPNPIQATIDMEASFDARTRLFYQIASGIKRARHVSRMSPQILESP